MPEIRRCSHLCILWRSQDTFGVRAFKALSVVKGKGFRHEKTKKKRGTYRGANLDTSVRSIKFDD